MHFSDRLMKNEKLLDIGIGMKLGTKISSRICDIGMMQQSDCTELSVWCAKLIKGDIAVVAREKNLGVKSHLLVPENKNPNYNFLAPHVIPHHITRNIYLQWHRLPH